MNNRYTSGFSKELLCIALSTHVILIVLLFYCFPSFHQLNFMSSDQSNPLFLRRIILFNCKCAHYMWHRGVVFITTVQFHSTKFKFWLCAGSNLPYAVSDVCDGEKLRQWSRPKKGLSHFVGHPLHKKQLIIYQLPILLIFILILLSFFLFVCFFMSLIHCFEVIDSFFFF